MLLILLLSVCNGQNLKATYNVVYNGKIPLGNGETKNYSLAYDGLLYHSGNKTISFLKPLYLLNYPEGQIKIQTSSGEGIQALRMDSVQKVAFFQNDTVVLWNIEGGNSLIPKRVLKLKIKTGLPYYKFFAGTKTVNGFLCKHAFLYYPSSEKPWADIWYYPEYKLPYSFFGIGNLPGLLVKGDFYTLNYTFELVSLKTNEPINESVFMPEYFKQRQGKNERDEKKKDSIRRKKIEIMSQ